METGILVLTQKGREALKEPPAELSPLCRNILVQVDGKKSLEDIHTTLRGLKGLEEGVRRLFDGKFVELSRECKDLIKILAQKMLGAKAPTLLKKIDELDAKYGPACWDHIDEVEKTARLFYGEVIANDLKAEIVKILRETHKQG